MKTIEEKAEEAWRYYCYRADGSLYSTCFQDGYIQGATEALQSQWRSVEDELPPYDTDILGMENGSVYMCQRLSMFDSEDEYIINDAGTFRPTRWCPIPKYEAKGGEQ